MAIMLGLGTLVGTAGTALASTVGPVPAFDPVPFSPAGCAIQYMANAHISYDNKNGVPEAAKANAKTTCKGKVELLTLQVVLTDVTTGESKRTEVDDQNASYLFNQETFLPCHGNTEHIYVGHALGTSTEDGKVYMQERDGQPTPVECSR